MQQTFLRSIRESLLKLHWYFKNSECYGWAMNTLHAYLASVDKAAIVVGELSKSEKDTAVARTRASTPSILHAVICFVTVHVIPDTYILENDKNSVMSLFTFPRPTAHYLVAWKRLSILNHPIQTKRASRRVLCQSAKCAAESKHREHESNMMHGTEASHGQHHVRWSRSASMS